MSEEIKKDVDTSSQEGEAQSVEELQEQLKKQTEIADNQKIRAEKAEGKNKKSEDKPAPKKEATEDQSLTSKDMLALMGDNVTDSEDVDYLQTVAKGFGMTIAEALKDPTIKAKLAEKQEERATAQATNTKGGTQSNSKVSDASILAKASKGNLPDNAKDMDRLVKARFEKK